MNEQNKKGYWKIRKPDLTMFAVAVVSFVLGVFSCPVITIVIVLIKGKPLF